MERRTVEEGIAKPEQARELAIQRLKMKQDFKGIAAGGALAVLICLLIWQFGDDSIPWPIWVAFGIAVILVIQGCGRPTAPVTGSPRPMCSGRWSGAEASRVRDSVRYADTHADSLLTPPGRRRR